MLKFGWYSLIVIKIKMVIIYISGGEIYFVKL